MRKSIVVLVISTILLTYSLNLSSENIGYSQETNPPIITIISPQNTTYTTKGEIELNFVINKETSWISYSLDKKSNIQITGNTTLTELSEGFHTITVFANDTAGNMGQPATAFFNIEYPNEDTIAPEITVYSNTTTFTDSVVSLNFSVNEQTSWIGYSMNQQPNVTINEISGLTGNITFPKLSDGKYNLIIYANDTAGNTGKLEFSFTVKTQQDTFIEPLIIIIILVIAALGIASIGFDYFKHREYQI